ncbi:Kae1-like domain-containing protein [Alkaliphilus hydrothermalis]|nr:O-sialoglycoprotein endopeptidase [Alkaliphilus hydrothermalis]
MIKKNLILGLDTSNYTTSMALLRTDGTLIREARRLLPVKEGTIGLRQSDALFHHVKNLPDLFEGLMADVSVEEIAAISSATKPRPVEKSYMPVFLASESYGRSLAAVLKVPFYKFSHQEGHIAAGLWSKEIRLKKPFIALHLSGGTTEALEVTPEDYGYSINIVGGSGDLSAGQFIDRIGVKLGLPFPAGPHLEKLAQGWQGEVINVPISVKGTNISFSGPETFVRREIEKNPNKDQIAHSVFEGVGATLVGLIKKLMKLYPHKEVLLVGGVASNQQIKGKLVSSFRDKGINLIYADPMFCSDNAVGIGVLGVKKYLGEVDFYDSKDH